MEIYTLYCIKNHKKFYITLYNFINEVDAELYKNNLIKIGLQFYEKRLDIFNKFIDIYSEDNELGFIDFSYSEIDFTETFIKDFISYDLIEYLNMYMEICRKLKSVFNQNDIEFSVIKTPLK